MAADVAPMRLSATWKLSALVALRVKISVTPIISAAYTAKTTIPNIVFSPLIRTPRPREQRRLSPKPSGEPRAKEQRGPYCKTPPPNKNGGRLSTVALDCVGFYECIVAHRRALHKRSQCLRGAHRVSISAVAGFVGEKAPYRRPDAAAGVSPAQHQSPPRSRSGRVYIGATV